MEWFKVFASDYANGVTAMATCGLFALTAITLWYLKREYSSKYRPYVFPVVHIEPSPDRSVYVVNVIPRNVGSHPCKIKVTNIKLAIGDEIYSTPDAQQWLLLGPQGVGVQLSAGQIYEPGIRNIREARYKSNRVEVSFLIHSSSTDGKFEESTRYAFEVDVRGENPQVVFRPEWGTATT